MPTGCVLCLDIRYIICLPYCKCIISLYSVSLYYKLQSLRSLTTNRSFKHHLFILFYVLPDDDYF